MDSNAFTILLTICVSLLLLSIGYAAGQSAGYEQGQAACYKPMVVK